VVLYVILGPGGGVAAAFPTEAEALDTIRLATAAHGQTYAARYALAVEDGQGGSTPIAQGTELVERAGHATVDQTEPRGV
jgi:hypothetical protein